MIQGVLPTVRILPFFVGKMEETISSFPVNDFVRKTLDDGYKKLVNVIIRNLNSAVAESQEEKEQQTLDIINIGNRTSL
jgi:hypothetical protein